MSLTFLVIAEANADFEQATGLADRLLVSEIDWLEDVYLDSLREWIGDDPDGERLTWKSIPEQARKLGIKAQGHFDEKPGEPDAQAARRTLAYLKRRFDTFDAVVLIRDLDNQPRRLEGFRQARQESTVRPIIIGVANAEREYWVLAGFVPETETERETLKAERQNLGFHPCERSHKLTAWGDDEAKLSPKRVLKTLTGGNRERERKCWLETRLDDLIARGRENGLAAYLDEVKTHLVPLIDPTKP